jgi:hypothetical protein
MSETEVLTEAPTQPGFYIYSGGAQIMVFLLDRSGQWWAAFDNAEMSRCEWGYIEQALSVWDLVRLDALTPDAPSTDPTPARVAATEETDA